MILGYRHSVEELKSNSGRRYWMNDKDRTVLLVFPGHFSIGRIDKLTANIEKQLQSKNIKLRSIMLENECLVFEMDDVVEGAGITREMFGIDKVAIAKKVPRARFEDIAAEIVNIGKLKVLPNEKFFVKVKISNSAKVNFKSRDLEFASTGDLTAALQSSSSLSCSSSRQSCSFSSSSARPAKNELEADRLIEIFIGKKSAYVCIEMDTGLGGLPFACQGEKVLCTIYNTLSAISCMIAVKCGFFPEIVILYTDDDDLRQNLKIFGMIANKMNIKNYSIRLVELDYGSDKFGKVLNLKKHRKQLLQKTMRQQQQRQLESSHKAILQDIVATQILTLMRGKGVVVPLSVAIHPLWLIESTFKKILSSKKVPWMPLLLPSQDIYDIAKELGMEKNKLLLLLDKSSMMDRPMTFTKQDYAKHRRRIEEMTESTKKNMKTISFEIGPNYLHDILDSV
jgi:adenylyl- and sulfurtransferase ThiI